MDLTTSILDSEMFTSDYFKQGDICRFCWSQDAENEIFSLKTENNKENRQGNLFAMVLFCLDIKLTVDMVPSKICHSCLLKIENFNNFKRLCQKTHLKLQQLFEMKNNHNPSKETNIIVKTEDTLISLEVPPKTESIDEFLDSLYPSDNGSEDEVPLKELKKKNPDSKLRVKKLKKSRTKCNICMLDFESLEKFNLHNSKSHGIEKNGYKCFGCEKIFTTRTGRVGHETNFCKYLKNGFKCGKCDKYLPSRGFYEKHMNYHRKKTSEELPDEVMKCKKCGERLTGIEALKKHKDLHSTRKRKYVCETCGRVFTRHDYLYKHRLTHSGTKQYQCPHCGYQTLQKSSLTIHIRKHTGERPFACDICPQQCVSSSNLQAHRRRHLGLKQYQCTLCNKKFGYKTSLDEHFASTHDRSQTHPCTLCNASYSRIRGLKRHILAKHSRGGKKTTIKDKKNAETSSVIEENMFDFVPKEATSLPEAIDVIRDESLNENVI